MHTLCKNTNLDLCSLLQPIVHAPESVWLRFILAFDKLPDKPTAELSGGDETTVVVKVVLHEDSTHPKERSNVKRYGAKKNPPGEGTVSDSLVDSLGHISPVDHLGHPFHQGVQPAHQLHPVCRYP